MTLRTARARVRLGPCNGTCGPAGADDKTGDHARVPRQQDRPKKEHVVVSRRSEGRRTNGLRGRNRRHGRVRSTMAAIDPTARIEPGAAIGENVYIGPYCVIGPHVQIGDGCKLIAHVYIAGHTTIGPRTVLYPFASLGTPPQSVKYRGGATRVVIGADCDIREGVTVNTGTEDDR